MSMCRHIIAKRKFRKEALLNRNEIYHVHLFHPLIPRLRRDGTWVQSVERRATKLDKQQRSSGKSVANEINVTLVADTVDRDYGEDEEVAMESTVSGTGLLSSSHSYEVENEWASSGIGNAEFPSYSAGPEKFVSPSKELMASKPTNTRDVTTAVLRKCVPRNTLVQLGTDIADVIIRLDTPAQHLLLNHLTEVKDLLSTGDYSDDRHARSKGIHGLAQILSSVSADRCPPIQGQLKCRGGRKRGRPTKYRLGHDNSTVSAKRPTKCSFCKMTGCRLNSCSVKSNWGMSDKVTEGTFTAISQKLGIIASGRDP